MAQFNYKALDRQGTVVSGTVEALDRRSAVALLTDQGRFVTEMIEGAMTDTGRTSSEIRLELPQGWSWRRKVSSKDLVALTSQFSTAVRAGLPLMACLELLRDQQKKPVMKDLMTDLAESVSGGLSLSDAMGHHPDVFSPLYLSMIRVGETGGILEDTTAQLAQILTREDRVKTHMKNASAYPLFVLCLGLISVVVIVTVILPRIMTSMDVEMSLMPWPTRFLMGLSDSFRSALTTLPGWIVLGIMVLAVQQGLKWIRSGRASGLGPFQVKDSYFRECVAYHRGGAVRPHLGCSDTRWCHDSGGPGCGA